jgi:hypothetical protein
VDPSRFLLALPDVDAPVPTVRAYGDQDDHLRLTVLLATALGDRADPALREACTARGTAWRDRRSALQQLLEEAHASGRQQDLVVRLVDPDALDMGDLDPLARWQDAAFRRERAELFALLLDRIAHGGWELIRPEPRQVTTAKLEQRDCEMIEPERPGGRISADEERLAAVADKLLVSSIRPLADKLVENEHLRARELARMLEAASSAAGANDVILEIAYDVMSGDAVEAGKRLSALRGPRLWNGVAGPFALPDVADDWIDQPDRIERRAAEELVQSGWVRVQQAADGTRRFDMANAARAFFRARATTTGPDRVVREHDWLARREARSVEDRVELHFHAVESGDATLAVATAQHYGADLRRIAYACSRKQGATRADFESAARIYRKIVEEFDASDAYAWEYLGYNLARAYGDEPIYPAGVEREIVAAYARASEIDPSNPLYKGREIGFQARLGLRVHDRLRHWMGRFSRSAGDLGLVIFADQVLKSLSRAVRRDLAREAWAIPLTNHPDLRSYFT